MSELTFKQAIKKLRKVSFAGNLSKAGKNTIASLAALILLPAAFAHAAIVSKDGNYDYTSIRAALNDPATAGETIIVKPDIYEESNLTVGGNRTLQAENPNSPESTIIDANDTNEPVISGAANATIIGFTIRGGNSNAPGAGIRPSGGSVVLQNLIIEDNVSSAQGGGVGSDTGGTVTIINCTVRNNKATIGGGVWMWGPEYAKITDSHIEGNEAFGNSSGSAAGGGVYASTYNYLEIENTTITGNFLTGSNHNDGAGIRVNAARLSNVTVSNNIANDGQYRSNGGGIYVVRGLDLAGGTISNNQAYRGGGVYLSASAWLTSSAVISGNTAREGIIGSGGGIYCSYPDNLQITSGAVSGNAPDDIGCIPSGQLPSGPTPNSCANDDASGTDADPINTFTGELFGQFSPDIDLGGPMPLFFARYYASGLLNANITGSLGNNWSHNFEWTLTHIGTHIHLVDNQGRLIQFSQNGSAWDLIGKTDIVYQLVENAGTFTLLDPRKEQLHKFNTTGQLTSVEDGKGNVHSLSYDVSGLLTQVADGLGRTLSFAYDSNDLLIGVGDSARTIIFSYTADDLTGVTDALGNLIIYTYASGGLMTSTTRPVGNKPYTQTFNGNGKVATQTDAYGNTFSFDYSDLETTLTDPLGNTRVHTHTATGELSNNQDQAGQSIVIGYDTVGRRNAITDRSGNTVYNAYDPLSSQLTSITLPDGNSVGFSYTPRVADGVTFYDQTGVTYPDGTNEAFTFDTAGNMTSHTDPRLNTASFSYTANGQRSQKINKLGGSTSYSYNADGTFASKTDPAGNTITFGYDLLKRVNLVTYSDGTSRAYTWDNNNRLLSEVDERGNSTTLTYDTNNRVVGVTDALGNVSTFAYDDNDRLISITDPLGNVSICTYDELGRLKTSSDGNGNGATLEYDGSGNITSISDSAGNAWLRSYDADGFISSISDPLGNTVTYLRDSLHRITRRTSPLGHNIDIVYDIMGRIRSTTDPLGNATIFTYNENGRVSSVALSGGTDTTYARNPLDQITTLTDGNGNNWYQAYDNMGRKVSVTDPLGNTTFFSYDNSNRVSLVTLPATMGTLDITYDATGNATRLLYSDGTDLNLTYDANGRVTTANGISQTFDANGRITNNNGIGISRDAGGRIISMTLAVGKTVTYTYDSRNLLTSITDWLGGTTTFTYDVAGHLTRIGRPNSVVTTYGYDSEDRVTSITEGSISTIALTRDGIGQITAATRNVPLEPNFTDSTQNLSFDAASQVSTYTYDSLGRLTNDGRRTYTWNLASRMTSYTEDANAVTFTYDALGQRLSRTQGGVTRSYVWNYTLGLPSVSVARQDGDDLYYYVYTPGGRLLYSIEETGNNRRDYHFDEMGNTLFVTDHTGAVVGSYAYSPYGQLLSSTGGLDNPFTWQGQYGVMDEGNGLYYMRARYYDSSRGRFTSRDPKKGTTPRTVNPYQYAMANPLLLVDPKGEKGSNEGSDFEGSMADKIITISTGVNQYATFIGEYSQEVYGDILFKDAKRIRSPDYVSLQKQEVVEDLWKRIDKAEKLGKKFERLGQAGDVLSAAGTGIKTAERLNKAHERGQAARATALEGHYAQMDELARAVRKGQISAAMAEKLIREIAATFDEETSIGSLWSSLWSSTGAWGRELVETKIESLVGIKETLKGLAGPAGDAADFALGLLGFKDPELN